MNYYLTSNRYIFFMMNHFCYFIWNILCIEGMEVFWVQRRKLAHYVKRVLGTIAI